MRLKELVKTIKDDKDYAIPNVLGDDRLVTVALVIGKNAKEMTILAAATKTITEIGDIPVILNKPIVYVVEVPVEVEVEKIVEQVNPADAEMEAEIKELKKELKIARTQATKAENRIIELQNALKTEPAE